MKCTYMKCTYMKCTMCVLRCNLREKEKKHRAFREGNLCMEYIPILFKTKKKQTKQKQVVSTPPLPLPKHEMPLHVHTFYLTCTL